jgi:hypothetical protein
LRASIGGTTSEHTYEEIGGEVGRIVATFDVADLKTVCRGFALTANLTSKTRCREKILHKITERKYRTERRDVSGKEHT